MIRYIIILINIAWQWKGIACQGMFSVISYITVCEKLFTFKRFTIAYNTNQNKAIQEQVL